MRVRTVIVVLTAVLGGCGDGSIETARHAGSGDGPARGDGASPDGAASRDGQASVDGPTTGDGRRDTDGAGASDGPAPPSGDGPAPEACPALLVQAGQSVDGFASDVYTWHDAAGRPRSAALVRNDAADPSGNFGGYLRRYVYETQGQTRTCVGASSSHPGWGYTVNHFGGSSSTSSRRAAGTYRTVLAGRHHAVHEYTWVQSIDSRNVDVTVHWSFATGRDHPTWAVTFDCTGVAANAINADTRAPYGDLRWDFGSDADVDGVGWGDRYKFRSLTSPISTSSGWDYTEPNLVPFAMEWAAGVDAEMGAVQTQTYRQHDAGGYWSYGAWGTAKTSGPMPLDYNWTYQLNQYELPFANGQKSKRLAWGANFGAVGQSVYNAYGDDRTLSGYPYQSYGVFMVLGRHSAGAVAAQVTQVETVQQTHLAASVGTVWTSGPAGVGRSDSTALEPAGWDHRYGTWNVIAADNRAAVTFVVDAGDLLNPVLVVSDLAPAASPTVKVDGVAQVPDADVFLSVDATARQVWVTLRRSLSGSHVVEIE
jgi:hypothetical protein